jgi:hypothetical protein
MNDDLDRAENQKAWKASSKLRFELDQYEPKTVKLFAFGYKQK